MASLLTSLLTVYSPNIAQRHSDATECGTNGALESLNRYQHQRETATVVGVAMRDDAAARG